MGWSDQPGGRDVRWNDASLLHTGVPIPQSLAPKAKGSHPSRSHISICDSPISAKIYPNSKPEKPSRSCCSQAQRAIGARGNAISAFSKRETPSLCEDIENDYAQAEREPD